MPDDVQALTSRPCVRSTNYSSDTATVVVIADERPGADTVLIEPNRTHVYRFSLAASG